MKRKKRLSDTYLPVLGVLPSMLPQAVEVLVGLAAVSTLVHLVLGALFALVLFFITLSWSKTRGTSLDRDRERMRLRLLLLLRRRKRLVLDLGWHVGLDLVWWHRVCTRVRRVCPGVLVVWMSTDGRGWRSRMDMPLNRLRIHGHVRC